MGDMQMNKLVKYIAAVVFSFSSPVFAGSLEGFISANKTLNDNVEARGLVKQEASLIAYSEALSEGVDDTEIRRKEILTQDGEKYGALALKKMTKFCSGENVSFTAPAEPDKETCQFFLSLK